MALDVRYDPATLSALVRVRPGRGVRTRRLSEQAVGEYDRGGRLISIQVEELDETAAEFIRNADEETLLRVIAAMAGRSKAGTGTRDAMAGAEERVVERPRATRRPAQKPRPKKPPAAAAAEEPAAKPKPRRRRRTRKAPASES